MNKGKILLFFFLSLSLSFTEHSSHLVLVQREWYYFLSDFSVFTLVPLRRRILFCFKTLKERVIGWANESERARVTAKKKKKNRRSQPKRIDRISWWKTAVKHTFKNPENFTEQTNPTIFFEIHMGNPCSKYKATLWFCGLTTKFLSLFSDHRRCCCVSAKMIIKIQ